MLAFHACMLCAAAPKRVVSILPSLTETVCALGQCHLLVGVDSYSDWPATVRKLPRVGGGIAPDIEAIVALKPDLVLLAASSRGIDRLAALGLNLLVLEPKTHADVQVALSTVAKALGLDASVAGKVWQQIDAGLANAAKSLPESVRGTRVYFEVNRAPYAAGASSFIGQTLARLGVDNIVPAELGPFPKLNPEFVVRANPDLIMVGQRGFEGMLQRPGWQRIRAVREHRICEFSREDEDIIVRPGPRMAEGANAMAKCLLKYSPGMVPKSTPQ